MTCNDLLKCLELSCHYFGLNTGNYILNIGVMSYAANSGFIPLNPDMGLSGSQEGQGAVGYAETKDEKKIL